MEFDPERTTVGVDFGFKRRKRRFIFVFTRWKCNMAGKNLFVFYLERTPIMCHRRRSIASFPNPKLRKNVNKRPFLTPHYINIRARVYVFVMNVLACTLTLPSSPHPRRSFIIPR